jgi:hypothetical protein
VRDRRSHRILESAAFERRIDAGLSDGAGEIGSEDW